MIYVAMSYESLTLLLMSRIPVGIFMQTMTMARSIVSDCSNASRELKASPRTRAYPLVWDSSWDPWWVEF